MDHFLSGVLAYFPSGVTTVSIWPALAIPIDLDRAGRPPGRRYLAFDLIRDGVLVAENADRLEVLKPIDEAGRARLGLTVPKDRL